MYNEIKIILAMLAIGVTILTVLVGINAVNYFYPEASDYDCLDFSTRAQLTTVANRAGWPYKDPYDLSRRSKIEPCSSYTYKDEKR